MEFRGIFEHGVVHPSGPVNLPEGTEVEFHPVAERNETANGAARYAAGETWKARSIDELAAEQGIGPVGSIDELEVEWLDDDPADSVDEFVRSLREWRK